MSIKHEVGSKHTFLLRLYDMKYELLLFEETIETEMIFQLLQMESLWKIKNEL